MFTVKISDSFVEWTFELGENKKLCIQDLVDAITEKTGLIVTKEFVSKEPDMPKIIAKCIAECQK